MSMSKTELARLVTRTARRMELSRIANLGGGLYGSVAILAIPILNKKIKKQNNKTNRKTKNSYHARRKSVLLPGWITC